MDIELLTVERDALDWAVDCVGREEWLAVPGADEGEFVAAMEWYEEEVFGPRVIPVSETDEESPLVTWLVNCALVHAQHYGGKAEYVDDPELWALRFLPARVRRADGQEEGLPTAVLPSV